MLHKCVLEPVVETIIKNILSLTICMMLMQGGMRFVGLLAVSAKMRNLLLSDLALTVMPLDYERSSTKLGTICHVGH